MDELNSFFDPKFMAYVKDVKFRISVRGEKKKTGRNLLVVSTHGLTEQEKQELLRRYLETFEKNWVSFPLKERASHLMTRIDRRVFNFGRLLVNWIPRFRRKSFQIPKSPVLETLVRLDPKEWENLQKYLENILHKRNKTIGGFHMNGTQFSRGAIDDNRPVRGKHNCSSWIATAPIGNKQEALLELLGGDRNLEIGTNPGWWTNWISATANEQRVPVLIHWTPKPLEKALSEISSGANFPWDFRRK